METTSNFNYYQVLDVSTDAAQEDIYQAYLRAKATYSLANPELFATFTPQEAVAWLEVIEEAYSIIGHPNTRKIYDKEITPLNDEGALPSFDFKTNDSETSYEDTNPSPAEEELPLAQGHGRTPLSTYIIDKNMEDLIAKQDIFAE